MLHLHPEIIDRLRVSNVKIYKQRWRGWRSQVVGLQVTEVLAAADGTSRGFSCVRASLMSCKSGQFLNEEASYGSVPICSQKSG